MPEQNLRDLLAALVARGIGLEGAERPGASTGTSGFRGGPGAGGGGAQATSPLSPRVLAITDDLLRQTFEDTSRFSYTSSDIDSEELTGGNTAGLVAHIGLRLGFALKFDETQAKLAKEGHTIRSIKTNPLLPEAFRRAWPDVYAIWEEQHGPYAYLMEWIPSADGWASLQDRLYKGKGDPPLNTVNARRWMEAILSVLFEGYGASINSRALPSLREDYFGRIRERLEATQRRDPAYAPRALIVNGQPLAPWDAYLAAIEPDLEGITPPFSTVAHGDPNPGNLMLRHGEDDGLEVKLIDPKEWASGDYLFDIAKITHFLEGTGPIENPAPGASVVLHWPEHTPAGPLEIVTEVPLPGWTVDLVTSCLERTKRFAESHGDAHWQARYELAMAANLLGLPLGRLSKGRHEAARLLYLQGLYHLHRYCALRGLSVSSGGPAVVPVARADASELEPERLAWLRQQVRSRVPGVTEAEDRRGFQLLHWPPLRPNGNDKPAELSLEHEARLRPPADGPADALLRALLASEGQAAAERLLPAGHQFAHLLVRRYQRDPGPQSTDRYYDIAPAAGAASLLPHAITVRERIRTSKFMTWSAGGDNPAAGTAPPRPLNLELPFVALGADGLTARLEFNWVDDLSTCLAEAADSSRPAEERLRNPLVLAQIHLDQFHPGLRLEPLEPVLEHTTYRQKFGLLAPPQSRDGEPVEVFVINVDTVVAQNLRSHRTGTYVDVDISSVHAVDHGELARLQRLVEGLASRYRLVPNLATKALRSAQVSGWFDP
jgi:hypothetical protein